MNSALQAASNARFQLQRERGSRRATCASRLALLILHWLTRCSSKRSIDETRHAVGMHWPTVDQVLHVVLGQPLGSRCVLQTSKNWPALASIGQRWRFEPAACEPGPCSARSNYSPLECNVHERPPSNSTDARIHRHPPPHGTGYGVVIAEQGRDDEGDPRCRGTRRCGKEGQRAHLRHDGSVIQSARLNQYLLQVLLALSFA